MKRTCAMAITFVLFGAMPAMAAPTTTKAKYPFTNCAALNAKYPHGVGRSGATDQGKGEPVTSFKVNTALYNRLPKTLDRDKDGVACEKA